MIGKQKEKFLHHQLLAVFYTPKLLNFYTLLILSFGVLTRLIPYLYNRSLWADEAVLALNIVNRSYGELFQPLDYEQGAPPFFLIIEKLAIQIFGNSEYALRLFSLLSGIASLWLFYLLGKRYLSATAVPIALAFFASQPRLIYYSSEVKQYSSDVAIALLLCLLLIPFKKRELNTRDVVIIGILGSILIWVSHPAIFVIAGMGFSSLLFDLREKKRINFIFKNLNIYFLFLISFIILYFVSLNNLNSNTTLMESWKNEFPSSPVDLAWLIVTFDRFFEKPLGFTGLADELAMITFVVGCFAFWKRDRQVLLTLLSPLFVTFLAAFLHKYPFSDRLVLFLVPFFILLMAEGINYLIFIPKKIASFLSIILCLSLLIPHLVDSGKQIILPSGKEEIKAVMSYVKNHQQPGDLLYVYQRGKYQFQYYADKYGYHQGDYIIGVDDLDNSDVAESQLSAQEWQRYKNDFDGLRGRDRVWFLFSHAHVEAENIAIKSYLDTIGKQVDFFEAKGAFVYLYDLDWNS